MRRLLIFLSLFLCVCFNVSAQDKQAVSGTIRDADGSPLPGITILEKGTKNGALTDAAGSFKLQVNPKAVLVISGIGFISQEIAVNGNSSLNVSLVVDNKNPETRNRG